MAINNTECHELTLGKLTSLSNVPWQTLGKVTVRQTFCVVFLQYINLYILFSHNHQSTLYLVHLFYWQIRHYRMHRAFSNSATRFSFDQQCNTTYSSYVYIILNSYLRTPVKSQHGANIKRINKLKSYKQFFLFFEWLVVQISDILIIVPK
jgi:hypothetical protein